DYAGLWVRLAFHHYNSTSSSLQVDYVSLGNDSLPMVRLTGPLSAAYWMLVTAVFLAWSFWGNHWDISWVIWPVAGVLYAALVPLFRVMAERKER
ncbi:MAG: hypothetical protein IKP72_04685, partial [Clostridia bacterium]|nr:hypothetical protein [Clostridia bacterium]